MYRIIICEDEEFFAVDLNNMCEQICGKLNIEYDITCYRNEITFLKNFLMEPQSFDLFLLDIILKNTRMNGMDLAKKIREKNTNATIIFVTCNKEFAIQGYEVQAMHYLLKPVDINLLEKLISTDYKNRFQKSFIVMKCGTQIEKLSFSEIIALEISGRKVAVYLHNRTLYYSGKIAELKKQLPSHIFIQCHQSYVLNIKNTRELTNTNAITVNGKIIPISRKHKKAVQMLFLEHLGRY